MKKYLIIFIGLTVACVNNRAKDSSPIITERNENLELYGNAVILKENYSNYLLIRAIDNIIFKSLLKVNYSEIDYFEYDDSLKAILKQSPNITDSLLFKIQKEKDADDKIKQLSIWCETYSLLLMCSNLDPSVSLEEILYEIPDTKKIIQSYLHYPNQDWGSLSESQIYEIPYKVCNYVSGLDDVDRIHFYELFVLKTKEQLK